MASASCVRVNPRCSRQACRRVLSGFPDMLHYANVGSQQSSRRMQMTGLRYNLQYAIVLRMAHKRKTHRPSDPLDIARRRAEERARERNPANWGVDAAALTLPANAGVEAQKDLRGRVSR